MIHMKYIKDVMDIIQNIDSDSFWMKKTLVASIIFLGAFLYFL